MHERLRTVLLSRIQRGTLSVTLLAEQTGYGHAHISNFLRDRRGLSVEAMDRILKAQRLRASDLLLMDIKMPKLPSGVESNKVPIVSHRAALFEPIIRTRTRQSFLDVPVTYIRWRRRPAHGRERWQRFVAIAISKNDALPMSPVIAPGAFLVLDRHWNSLMRYNKARPNIYAVQYHGKLILRYAEFQLSGLILRPHNPEFDMGTLPIGHHETPNDYLIGRAVMTLHDF